MTQRIQPFDENVLGDVAAGLNLRAPNRDAIHTLAICLDRHYATSKDPFEAVLDAATGVGKTYIIAGGIDYFAARGGRNFAVITPGQAILTKTVAQFSDGTKKSLLGGMTVTPVVITADNFDSASMRADMEDPDKVKLYVFSVQSLIRPSSKAGRRTHEFHEGLGTAFYTHLESLRDLIVFADEHHAYYGKSFSAAIRELHPWALVGLTGTPHAKTPKEQVIFRYPLTAAIADELVKTPVIVGRRDDLTDEHVQLLDGVQLLEAKQQTLDRYAEEEGAPRLNAILLVNCRDIAHAEEVGAFLASDAFRGGAYADAVLVVHSDKSEDALRALDEVEEPESPVRIIVQVGMLREGWDVKTVFVIASLRASVSEILTEQTMGRGLRLPFGRYTGWQMLDTLDVLAHEQYEKVLARSQALQESFIDHRTVLRNTKGQDGKVITSIETERVDVPVAGGDDTPVPPVDAGDWTPPAPVIRIADQQERLDVAKTPPLIDPRSDAEEIIVPRVEVQAAGATFSLAEVTDLAPYIDLGQRLATMPDSSLRRTVLGAHSGQDLAGDRFAEVATSTPVDVIEASDSAVPVETAREAIAQAVRSSGSVPGRKGEGAQVQRLLDAVATGAGDQADKLFTRYPSRVASDLIGLVVRDQQRIASKGQEHTEVRVAPFEPRPHRGREKRSSNHAGKFSRATAYGGWSKSLYPEVAFDSATERAMAVLLDADAAVRLWVRLERGDLPLLWGGASHEYHPDFLVIDADGNHWLIEVKADRDVERDDVQAKKQAALTWVNVVNAEPAVTSTWGYALVSESNLTAAKGSWPALIAAAR